MANEKRLIDANALENLIRTNAKVEAKDTKYDIGRVHGLINAADLIHNAPTVDAVEVVHGRWIETKNGFHCSNCKGEPGRHQTQRGVYLSDYCPKCGAKMDGGKNDGC